MHDDASYHREQSVLLSVFGFSKVIY
uniref:Uncharacterized protein n=1 Tax=Rhizophora mucronata TaxID=61149 RepID=A0A2P2NUS4_RHIMU